MHCRNDQRARHPGLHRQWRPEVPVCLRQYRSRTPSDACGRRRSRHAVSREPRNMHAAVIRVSSQHIFVNTTKTLNARAHRVAAVAILICAVSGALGSVARAQELSSPDAKLPKVSVSPKKINFGKVPTGTTKTSPQVTFTNKSSATFAPPVVSVTGAGYGIDTNDCPGGVTSPSTFPLIAPGGTCHVTVTFDPPHVGK